METFSNGRISDDLIHRTNHPRILGHLLTSYVTSDRGHMCDKANLITLKDGNFDDISLDTRNYFQFIWCYCLSTNGQSRICSLDNRNDSKLGCSTFFYIIRQIYHVFSCAHPLWSFLSFCIIGDNLRCEYAIKTPKLISDLNSTQLPGTVIFFMVFDSFHSSSWMYSS